MAIDSFAPDDAVWKKEKNALTTRAEIGGRNVILVKPQTYMNNSGDAVAPLMAFYKIPVENVTVIHDDMDLKLGTMREKIGGGSAGHNGIKSIDAAIGKEYKRIRIGIGHPRDFENPINPADWVLGKFNNEQLKQIKSVIKSIKF
jgi:PTH1 family peptidyl-tRNA hydrolase